MTCREHRHSDRQQPKEDDQIPPETDFGTNEHRGDNGSDQDQQDRDIGNPKADCVFNGGRGQQDRE